MNQEKLARVAKTVAPKKKHLQHCLFAFISGGLLGVLGQALYDLFYNLGNFTKEDAMTLMIITVIGTASLLTALGAYDHYSERAGAGAFVPITGFANSLTSGTVDSRSEGPIRGIGANIFKLAGCVITYGVVAAYVIAFIALGARLLW